MVCSCRGPKLHLPPARPEFPQLPTPKLRAVAPGRRPINTSLRPMRCRRCGPTRLIGGISPSGARDVLWRRCRPARNWLATTCPTWARASPGRRCGERCRRRLWGGARLAADGLCGCQPACPGGRLHPAHLHGDDRGRAGKRHRRRPFHAGRFRRWHARAASDSGAGRGVLLYLLQGYGAGSMNVFHAIYSTFDEVVQMGPVATEPEAHFTKLCHPKVSRVADPEAST